MGSVSSIAELRSDPERLLNGAAGQQELAVLGSLRSITVPPGAKGLVWNALGIQAVGTGLTAVANPSSWPTSFWRGTVKALAMSKAAVAVPVVIAALGAGALHYRSSSSPEPASENRAPSGQATSRRASEAPNSEPSAEPAAAPSSAAQVRSAPSTSVKDHLREESALLERARALLRSGRPGAAQATLLRLQSQFPKGALTQEREVLLIEALAARGASGAAARDARSFVAAHPESPHAVQLRRFIEQPAGGEARPN
jgi:hypothetical protein